MRNKLVNLVAAGSLCIGLGAPAMAYDYTVQGSLLYPSLQTGHYNDGVLQAGTGRNWVSQNAGTHRHDWTLTTLTGSGAMHQTASSLTEKQCMLRARAEVDVAACRPIGGQNGSEICEDMPLAPAAACSEQ